MSSSAVIWVPPHFFVRKTSTSCQKAILLKFQVSFNIYQPSSFQISNCLSQISSIFLNWGASFMLLTIQDFNHQSFPFKNSVFRTKRKDFSPQSLVVIFKACKNHSGVLKHFLQKGEGYFRSLSVWIFCAKPG